VQLELNKGDVIFFSPAIFHAAGENKSTDIQRLVNLLQVSSAFGRAMESIDRVQLSTYNAGLWTVNHFFDIPS
jgi:ectoine hydroxylase-related dioxygenase (phytanoyl-CoA dioxygenase family)